MNIGIIFYSETGNTKAAAQILGESLAAAGHSVKMEQIITCGRVRPGMRHFTLKTTPGVEPYDAIVFATPVMAFNVNPAMNAYISQISSLKNKPVAFLITKKLPFRWTGAHQAVNWMKINCESKGASVLGSGIIFWNKSDRDKQIGKVTEQITSFF